MALLRNCIGCGQEDDHPRHVTDFGDWHNDCHARSANGCELCKAVVDSAGDLKGGDLRAHIEQYDPAKSVLVARGLVAKEA